MRRTQVYLTDEQRALLQQRSRNAGVSEAEIIRRILDESLGLGRDRAAELAAVAATAGLWADRSDEELAAIRGRTAAERLTDLGL